MTNNKTTTVKGSTSYKFVTYKVATGQLPVDLIAQLAEHCSGIAEVMGSNPVKPDFFSGFNFITAQVGRITAKINHVFTSFSAVQIYEISFIHLYS